MGLPMRREIRTRPGLRDGRSTELATRISRLLPTVHLSYIEVRDVFILQGYHDLDDRTFGRLFIDPVCSELLKAGDQRSPAGAGIAAHEAAEQESSWDYSIEIAVKPGVTDTVADTAAAALASETGVEIVGTADASLSGNATPEKGTVQTARRYLLGGLGFEEAQAVAAELHNPLIEFAEILSRETYRAGKRHPDTYPLHPDPAPPTVERYDVSSMDDPALIELSNERLLALSREELHAIAEHYRDPKIIEARMAAGLPAEATDCELEMLAQTWSEHCKHKIFQAGIRYLEYSGAPDPQGSSQTSVSEERIEGLFATYIRGTTDAVSKGREDILSVFHDNSGVVAFDDEHVVCFKAETHNSPSALDPYGGAITGIVGVNRDIMGTGRGARPILNTNVLCFGYPDTSGSELPRGIMPPERVLRGVHHGIVDGGNQSGIPTVAGAFLFDESFMGKPLVFCGTAGIMPRLLGGRPSWEEDIDPGDIAVMVGGRIGKDGIHGATFSSLALEEESPSSAVQIGDPITQRRMMDFLLEARDLGLYKGITDNGAGGLSSSLGEMARSSGGVEIELASCPLKYPGLAPWEILVSESQERMSLALDPSTQVQFFELARRRGVEASRVGRFTGDGYIRLYYENKAVGLLPLSFLHDGVPQMELCARWIPPEHRYAASIVPALPIHTKQLPDLGTPPLPAHTDHPERLRADFLRILANPNVSSKESWIRQYDHEVQAASYGKPFSGPEQAGPSDGAVLRPGFSGSRGLSVTHGICPRYGDWDTEHMAAAAVDEAYRAHIALGGDPDRAYLLDNFCWPDPVQSESTPDGEYKLAQLVRACRGLRSACEAYGLPLISGKDSMKNDADLAGRKVSVRPTLLMSLIGIIEQSENYVSSDFKVAGDLIYLLGETRGELGGTMYETVSGHPLGESPCPNLTTAPSFYRAVAALTGAGLVRSAHDLSDGGLAIAVAECAIASRTAGTAYGADIKLEALPLGARPGRADLIPLFETARLLFSESCSRFLVTVAPKDRVAFEAGMKGFSFAQVGTVTQKAFVRFTRSGEELVQIPVAELEEAFTTPILPGESRHDRRATVEGPSRAVSASGAAKATKITKNTRTTKKPEDAQQPKSEPLGSNLSAEGAPRALVLTGYGINADLELAEAFRRAGGSVEMLPFSELLLDARLLSRGRILALPGGFSFGDHLGSGMVLAGLLKRKLRQEIDAYVADGGLVLGVCNGFQVLVKSGLLPNLSGDWEPAVSLTHNDQACFEDSWVSLDREPGNTSPWLTGLTRLECPIRHGEGRFVYASADVREGIRQGKLIAFRYSGRNPNGSADNVAGITDVSGRILGLMPHPEAFLEPSLHPAYPRSRYGDYPLPEDALAPFRNAVSYAGQI